MFGPVVGMMGRHNGVTGYWKQIYTQIKSDNRKQIILLIKKLKSEQFLFETIKIVIYHSSIYEIWMESIKKLLDFTCFDETKNKTDYWKQKYLQGISNLRKFFLSSVNSH